MPPADPPIAVDWEQYWSQEGRDRHAPQLQSLCNKFLGMPGVVGMHGGLPPSDTFAFSAFSLQMADGETLDIASERAVQAAQQYVFNPQGYPPLVDWLTPLTQDLHKPAGQVQCVVTSGATQAIDIIFSLLLDRGSPLLVEEFSYSHALEAQFMPRGYHLLPVPMDAQGLVPHALDALLASRQAAGLALPAVLYTIPRGQNPTGACMSQERLLELYRVARRWRLLVVEDDAYYWLQYPRGEADVPGLDLPPGLLSLDTDGRVIRIDTTAKLLGPGFRVGWLTAHSALAQRAGLAVLATTMGANSVSQVALDALLRRWGRSGFHNFLCRLQRRYGAAAAAAQAAAGRHLAGVASWSPLQAGMFLWVKLEGLEDAEAALAAGRERHAVVVAPGRIFHAASLMELQQQRQLAAGAAGANSSCDAALSAPTPRPCPFFRVSFMSAAAEDMDEGFRRLRAAIDECAAARSAGADAGGRTAAPANGTCHQAAGGQHEPHTAGAGNGQQAGAVGAGDAGPGVVLVEGCPAAVSNGGLGCKG